MSTLALVQRTSCGSRSSPSYSSEPWHVLLRGMPVPDLTSAPARAHERPLSPASKTRDAPRRRKLPREWDAYYPAGILLVDRPEVVQLFVASGVIIQARIAVVSLDGYPEHVTHWLRRGAQAGFHAPVAFLHDSTTVVYPFSFEPLATLLKQQNKEPLLFRDLGIPPGGLAFGKRVLPTTPRYFKLSDAPSTLLITYATRELLSMTPRDRMLLPLSEETPRPSPAHPSGARNL